MVYGLGGVASRLVNLLMLPLFTRFLTPVDYGVLAMLAIMTNLLVGAVSLGTGNSMGICFNEVRNPIQRTTVVWSTCAVVVSSAALWTAMGLLAAGPVSALLFGSAEYAIAVALAFGQLAVSAAVVPLLGRWRMEERARPYVFATVGLTVATVAANAVTVAGLGLGLLGMLWSTFLVQAAYCAILYGVFWRADPPKIAWAWARRVVRLGWPSIFGVGAFFVLDFGGRVILEHHAGLQTLGVYSIGLMFGLAITILAEGAFGAAWPGFFLSFLGRPLEARRVFGRVLYYYLVFFLTLAAAFFLFAGPLVTLLTAPAFHPAAGVVGLIALCGLLKGVYLIFLPGLYFERKLYLQTALEWGGALVGLAASLLLVPLFGIFGAAGGALLGYVFLCLATIVVSRRFLAIEVDVTRLVLLVASFAGVAMVASLPLADGALANWLVRSVLLAAYAGFVWRVFVGGTLADVRRELLAA